MVGSILMPGTRPDDRYLGSLLYLIFLVALCRAVWPTVPGYEALYPGTDGRHPKPRLSSILRCQFLFLCSTAARARKENFHRQGRLIRALSKADEKHWEKFGQIPIARSVLS
jgi:hypothetical protein